MMPTPLTTTFWRPVGAGVLALAVLALSACTTLPRSDPLQVTVAGIESLPGEGLELRMLVKLRVQNPNDTPLDYDGVYVRLDLLERTFATGVTDAQGTIPRYGESVVAVPVTASVLRMVRQALGFFGGEPPGKVTYGLSGKIHRATGGAVRFRSSGEIDLRATTAPAPAGPTPTPSP
jgi:hypothetical protein